MMGKLLFSRRFMPLFMTQFLGALNDNIFRNALVIFVLFTLAPPHAQLYATAAAGVFIFPFVLFSALAGQLADKFDKARLMRVIKAAEIVIMLLAAVAFHLHSAPLLLTVLFLMGTHSAFFGPVKYSILPQHLPPSQLVAGNGLLSLGTFVAILLGTIIGALGISSKNGVEIILSISLLVAAGGFACSLYVPPAPADASNAALPARPLKDTIEMLKLTLAKKEIRRSAIAISWFWFLGASYLTQFPNLAKHIFHANEEVVTLFLAMFTLGVAAGSLLCGKILHDKISTRLAPAAAAALVFFGVDFYIAARAYHPAGTGLADIGIFLGHGFLSCRLLFDLFMTAVAGGIFYVPLYARAQNLTELKNRARTMAGIGFFNAVFMVLSSLLGMVLLALGFSGLDVLLASVIPTIGMVFYCNTPKNP